MKLEVKNLVKTFGGRRVLDGVSAVFETGNIYGLFGCAPSHRFATSTRSLSSGTSTAGAWMQGGSGRSCPPEAERCS